MLTGQGKKEEVSFACTKISLTKIYSQLRKPIWTARLYLTTLKAKVKKRLDWLIRAVKSKK